jgi:transcription elongation factor Elf1
MKQGIELKDVAGFGNDLAVHDQHRFASRNMPDERTTGDFIHFVEQPPKRKRAEAVCVHCHSKKIKCDVHARTEAGQAKCSNCDTGRRECRIRNSQRGRRKHSESSNAFPNQSNAIRSPADGNEDEIQEIGHDFATIGPSADDRLSPSTASNRHASNPEHPLLNIGHERQVEPLTRLTPVSEVRSGNAVHVHADEVDAGYLQVYGLENQMDAQLQEIQAMPLPGHADSSSQPTDASLMSTFLETYWDYCYCFCPVLDRATISNEMARSPMLSSAITLAASHVQPPLLPHEGPEKYYNKARMLFYEDGEPDNVLALKALSLFYWWAPRPPSTIHRHTSWWWQSVIIRHAQQMGVHREPPIGDPLRARLDMSIRRRIWWTAFVSSRFPRTKMTC